MAISHGKKYTAAAQQINVSGKVDIQKAVAFVKKAAFAKFDESIDIDVNLGVDSSKSEQNVRGSVLLPHSSGKAKRIIVFAKDNYADEAQSAGADFVGTTDLVEKIQGGWLDFDFAIATPDLMGMVGKLAKLLGPRGLLPNKKVGTVTFDVAAAVADFKKGRAFFKSDRNGLVHMSIGRKSVDESKLGENFDVFMRALIAARPPSAKGRFIQKVTVSSTMGPGVEVDVSDAFKV